VSYRYTGSGFRINVKPGEIVSDTLARLKTEQHGVDRPTGQLLVAQVRMVHAIEDVRVAIDFEQARDALVRALEEIARASFGLVKD
jgi:hypothetical protein